jgi:Fe-S-cluster formation regulator IscX/YfhJ
MDDSEFHPAPSPVKPAKKARFSDQDEIIPELQSFTEDIDTSNENTESNAHSSVDEGRYIRVNDITSLLFDGIHISSPTFMHQIFEEESALLTSFFRSHAR